jgi:mono/diheme cytochrome c family protein
MCSRRCSPELEHLFNRMTAPDLLAFFGRLHPVVLHAPIGLLIGLAALEAAAAARPSAAMRGAIAAMAWFTALASAVAVLTGLTLSRESEYGGETLQLHQWLGIGFGASCLVVAGLHLASAAGTRRGALLAYRVMLVLTLIVMLPAGHLGATMTHGEGFLTEPLRAARRPVEAPSTEGAGVFLAQIKPIFDSRCVSCHGPRKHEGGLRLDSPGAILEGSEFGPVLGEGHGESSEIARRIRLAPDDEDHMPPKGRAPLTDEQIKAIEGWIAAGAPFEGGLAATPLQDEPLPVDSDESETAAGLSVPAPDPAALSALHDALVHVQELEAGSGLLWVDFAATAVSVDDDTVKRLLTPLVDQIAELSLARTRVSDAALELAGRMPRLRRLDVRATGVTDVGVAHLTGHQALEELNVVGTKVTDAAAEIFGSIPNLARIHAWSSGLTPEGAAAIRAARPALLISTGDPGDSRALETEGDLAFSSDAPLPGQGPATALTPVNAACPVSGAPVNPKFSVVHEGRVVGFCCPNCPKEFWADPAKFADKLPR